MRLVMSTDMLRRLTNRRFMIIIYYYSELTSYCGLSSNCFGHVKKLEDDDDDDGYISGVYFQVLIY